MSRSTAILGVALAVSALLNVVMLRRGAEPSTPSARPESRSPRSAEGKADVATPDALAAELDKERKLTRELRESIKRLEADREVLALSATSSAPAGAAKSPTAGLREKLRKMKKLFKGSIDGVQPDQEEMLELSGEMMEIMRMGLARSKDPKTYAEFVQACREVALEDEAALTPAQSAEYARISQEMADALGRISAPTAVERLIQELEVESGSLARMDALLTPAQKEVMQKGGMDDMASMSSGMSTTYLQKANAADTIVKTWTQSYQLQDAQLPAARAAAESFLRELEASKPGVAGTMNYDTRISALKAQRAALKTMEGALTAAQLDRLGTQSPREFHLFDVVMPVEVPEKK